MAETLEIQIKDVAPGGGPAAPSTPPPAPTYALAGGPPTPPTHALAGAEGALPLPLPVYVVNGGSGRKKRRRENEEEEEGDGEPSDGPPEYQPPDAPSYSTPAGEAAGGEAAGGEAAGAEAAEAAGAEVAGPAAVVLAAVQAVVDTADKAVKAAAPYLNAIASLNPSAFAGALEDAERKIPIFGELIADSSHELLAFAAAVGQTARRLSQYNGQLAVSQAKADVAQIVGDVRRAQMLSSGLSRFTDQSSRISQGSQDLMAKTLAALLPVVNQILELLADGFDGIGDSLDPVLEELADTAAYMGAALELMLTWNLDKTNADLKNTLDKISDVFKKGQKNDFNPLKEIFAAQIGQQNVAAAAANFAPGGQFAPNFGR